MKYILKFDRIRSAELVEQTEADNLVEYYSAILSNQSLADLSKFVNLMLALGVHRSHWCDATSSLTNWTGFFHPIATVIGAHFVRGAEWWVRRRLVNESMAFHFDKDEHSFEKSGKMTTPWRSTVLYLSSSGGPTIVTNQSVDGSSQIVPTVPTRVVLVECELNRLLSFPGKFSHAVAGIEGTGMRTTLIVNWWKDRPMGLVETPSFADFPRISAANFRRVVPHALEGRLFEEA